MSIGKWKDGGFEIEVNRWDHEIFGKGGKRGLLNKKIIRMIRAQLDYTEKPSFSGDSYISCSTLQFWKFGKLLGISSTTVDRQIRTLMELTMVKSKEDISPSLHGRRVRRIRSTNFETKENSLPGGGGEWAWGQRRPTIPPTMPIDSLTIKIDLKKLSKLLGWGEDDYGDFDLVSLEN